MMQESVSEGSKEFSNIREDNSAISTKLCSEQNNMNLIMYGVFAIGFLLETGLFVVAKIVDKEVLLYLPFAISAYVIVAAVCHYLIHINGGYMAIYSESSIMRFEEDKKEHLYNSYFIGAANLCILSLIFVPAFWACYQSQTSLGVVSLLIALAFFLLSQPAASAGWLKVKDKYQNLKPTND